MPRDPLGVSAKSTYAFERSPRESVFIFDEAIERSEDNPPLPYSFYIINAHHKKGLTVVSPFL